MDAATSGEERTERIAKQMDKAKTTPSLNFLLVGLILLLMVSGLLSAFVPFIECPAHYVVNAESDGHRLWGLEECVYCGGKTDPNHHNRLTVVRWCRGKMRY